MKLEERFNVFTQIIGGKYIPKEFYDYLRQYKIQGQIMCPNTSQQNCVVEMKNHHLIEVCQSMLHAKDVPSKF